MSAPVAASELDVAVRFAVDAENPAAENPAPSGRPMVGGACVLCACVSARRWYRMDEEAEEPGDALSAGAAPIRAPSATPTYVAGLGTSRERRLPLVLAPVRSTWAGAGAGAPPNAAQLCPHCHVQNEQLWFESGSNASTASNALASVRDTMRNFDRIMGILAPPRSSGARGAAASRPRRRAGKKAHGGVHGGVGVVPSSPNEGAAHRGASEEDLERVGLSRSAPSHASHAFLGAPLSASRAAARDASLREELVEAARLGQRRRRRWANDRLLRELGGAMTVAEMQAQFMPPPFGAPPQPTAFERMLRAQARGEWAGFHKVDMDKERAFLRELELAEHEARRERARGGEREAKTDKDERRGDERDERDEPAGYAPDPHVGPRAAWGRVSAKERAALRNVVRRAPERLERLERALLEFAEAAGELELLESSSGDPEPGSHALADAYEHLVLPLADSYARLLAHGLCAFHGFERSSRVAPSGEKELVVAPPRTKARDAGVWQPPAVTCVSFLRSLEALR